MIMLVMMIVMVVMVMVPYIIVTCAGVEHDRERPAGSRRASFLIRWTFEPSKGISHFYFSDISIFTYIFT